MEETGSIRDGKFLRPRNRKELPGGERFQRVLKKILRGAGMLLLLALVLFLGHGVYAHLLENPSFRVREIQVEGCHTLSRETLVTLARVEGMPNLFTVRLKEIAKRLEPHPWIENVVLEKVFPDTIRIRIEERKPIAILQMEDRYYIDAKGVIFSPAEEGSGLNYPYLTGLTRKALEAQGEETQFLITKALELLLRVGMEKAGPLEEISEIQMERVGGIRCFTRSESLVVKMGWDDFGEKLKRLTMVWSDLRKRGWSAVSIDCSDLNRFVVKKTSGGVEPGRR
jgi:cell division protein FtsQ